MQNDWLNTNYSFSFANYRDPAHMGFRSLRVMNEDWIKGASGFPTHPHRDMEIVTYVMQGGLQHRDSMGNGGVITPNLVQRMSAGTGIYHSEFNASATESCHSFQIWVYPKRPGGAPRYETFAHARGDKAEALRAFTAAVGKRDNGCVNVAPLLGKAMVLYEQDKPLEALQLYERALRTNPQAPASLRVALGACHLKLGAEATEPAEAREAFERCASEAQAALSAAEDASASLATAAAAVSAAAAVAGGAPWWAWES
jgi:redox-sensitive bicupin YhaK (pirin superfamily)